jgi:hypothetical protein
MSDTKSDEAMRQMIRLAETTDGGGHGTRFVDDLVEIVLAEGLRGLAFTDASPGVTDGAGYWRAYVAKRPHLALEGGAPTLETRLVRAARTQGSA